MREDLHCPMGEIPLLAPELISVLRRTDWPRTQFGVRTPGGMRSDARCYADEIHDAVLHPEDEIAELLGAVLVTAKLQTPPAA
jgi:hypothetical protein